MINNSDTHGVLKLADALSTSVQLSLQRVNFGF